jgi:hypothetical protein
MAAARRRQLVTASGSTSGLAMRALVDAMARGTMMCSAAMFGAMMCGAMAATVLGAVLAAAPVRAQGPELTNDNIEINYIPPSSERFEDLYGRLRRRAVLEDLRAFLSPLILPRKLRLSTRECGEINAFYSRYDGLIICYEYVEFIERLAPRDVTPEGFTRAEGIAGAFIEVTLHELGHALFDLYKIPVFGREEDAADQMAAFVMVQFSRDLARLAIKGAAYSYWSQQTTWTFSKFSDEHGAELQRFYNYLCLAYGGFPDTFSDFVEGGLLPSGRAVYCAHEYEQVKRAFVLTVLPSIDREKMRRVQEIPWVRPDDGR